MSVQVSTHNSLTRTHHRQYSHGRTPSFSFLPEDILSTVLMKESWKNPPLLDEVQQNVVITGTVKGYNNDSVVIISLPDHVPGKVEDASNNVITDQWRYYDRLSYFAASIFVIFSFISSRVRMRHGKIVVFPVFLSLLFLFPLMYHQPTRPVSFVLQRPQWSGLNDKVVDKKIVREFAEILQPHISGTISLHSSFLKPTWHWNR